MLSFGHFPLYIFEPKINHMNIEEHNQFVLEVLDSTVKILNRSNSSKEKLENLAILRDAASPEELSIIRWGLCQTYSPDITFGVTSAAVKKYNKSNGNVLSVGDLMTKLADRELTGHAALATICATVENLNDDLKDIVYNMLDKNLKIRMDAASINKVFPGLITVFEVSLCNVYADRSHKVDFEKDDWYASRKLDGCVSGDTLITVENGDRLPIKDIVESKLPIKVRTYNIETGKIEYDRILNYMKNMDDINENTHQWYEIELEDGRKIKITGNHNVFIPEIECYRRVDELTGDEEFLID